MAPNALENNFFPLFNFFFKLGEYSRIFCTEIVQFSAELDYILRIHFENWFSTWFYFFYFYTHSNSIRIIIIVRRLGWCWKYTIFMAWKTVWIQVPVYDSFIDWIIFSFICLKLKVKFGWKFLPLVWLVTDQNLDPSIYQYPRVLYSNRTYSMKCSKYYVYSRILCFFTKSPD